MGSFVSSNRASICELNEHMSDVNAESFIHSVNNDDYVFIRKFGTVTEFVSGVKSLDTVLENIASFSNEVRQINA